MLGRSRARWSPHVRHMKLMMLVLTVGFSALSLLVYYYQTSLASFPSHLASHLSPSALRTILLPANQSTPYLLHPLSSPKATRVGSSVNISSDFSKGDAATRKEFSVDGRGVNSSSKLSKATRKEFSVDGSGVNALSTLSDDNVANQGHVVGNGTSDVPLLTLFTTWVNLDDLRLVRELTLRNWAQLKPVVVPVLFTNDSTLRAEAQKSGWETLDVTRTVTGVPVLKHMYLEARRKFSSTLYAFSNGDILYTDDLVDTLRSVLKDPTIRLKDPTVPLLVVGQRWNIGKVTSEEARNFTSIKRAATQRGAGASMAWVDFFITNREYPWDSFPDMIIGRMFYDEWIVIDAREKNYTVVDISSTNTAVHQSTRTKHPHPKQENSYNNRLIKRFYKRKSIGYRKGFINCSPWITVHDAEGKVTVTQRTTKLNHC